MRNFYYFTFTQYDTFIQYMKHQKKNKLLKNRLFKPRGKK